LNSPLELSASPNSSSRTHKVLLGAIIGLAIAIRFPGLGVPLSGDEATTFWDHASSSWKTIFSQYKGPNQHSLFSFLSNLSIQIFGENEISFRLPSAAAGVLIVPLTWFAGRLLLNSQNASLLAAFLIGLSAPLFESSQQGRGYTLSVALALMVLIAGKKFVSGDRNIRWNWAITLVLSGLGMVLAIPSNIYFLVGCSAFFVLDAYLNNKKEANNKSLVFTVLMVGIMGGFATGYLLFIYDDLQRGLEIYRVYAAKIEGLPSLEPTFNRSLEVFNELIKPWGIPLVFLSIYGFWRLRQPGLLLIFIFPFAFNLIMNVQGPPRSYYYWTPFIMLFAANGMACIIEGVTERLALSKRKLPAIGIFIILLVGPLYFLKEYYEQRFDVDFVKMEEGQLAREYINKLPNNHLLVFPYDDRVLRYYIEKQVAENMLQILQNGKLNRIIFLGHKSVPVETIPITGGSLKPIFLPQLFNHSIELGALKISRLDFKISNFIPLQKDFNYQDRLNLQSFPDSLPGNDVKHKIVGKESLKITHEGPPVQHSSRSKLTVINPSGHAYILYVYAEKLWQHSKAGLLSTKKFASDPNYLNYMFGIFREEEGNLYWEPEHPYRNFRKSAREGEFYWHIIMVVNPINPGENVFYETLQIAKETSYYDGLQAFFLHSQ
jgi:hypothetical protein